ncbi:serine/threonine-protein kinase STY13-like isoform X1 [Mangifera indica]|uniref:serine/threonine-protein kinase STY13-like isoform X1 n=1 Tax=Mangifera indica TaxID=29780 RepID=UPI001CF9E6D9|nr:serine/threonine-protein kinase STY13-like isoform X1 [Mangifera indica]
MDLNTKDGPRIAISPKKFDNQEGSVNSKMKGTGTSSSKDMLVRADKVDLKSLDMKLEKGLSWLWSRNSETQRTKEEWEIDLSKLEIRNAIAQGTYGTVFRGVYDNQDVAVKLLDWGDDSIATTAEITALRSSFRQEVAVWQKLNHPNVTKFVGASMGTSNLKIPAKNPSSNADNTLPPQACCVVVEYLPGGTLKQYLIRNRRKKLAFKVVIQLALDLARGLSYLHSKKIVHRDVKTENMLLDAHRNLKIADFGVARVEAQNPQDMTGETGTLGYMAPEVLQGKPYNRRCDVYSFGICLWEIYCCDMPYPDLSFADVSAAVVRQNLRPDIPRCCPNSLANVMRKCWDGNPERRPEMDEVVRMLEAIDTSKGGGMIPEDQSRGCFCFAPVRGP